ncbi:hypothetical protein Phi13:2_gp094 [Cellulophaga phage phi13:2]|uniref:Uncharacterized protein n=4 Tax=Pachyviridae TaxID=2946166 RepID=R9ZZS7_9CAUD|nr:hypothetical protein Phi19:3_gp099 [Cellulophaga phage phi19:3]YP_008241133.1 hypothetical protein Phi46:3_gp090 [Cellulophaga phage phi46:3]YP_008241287.1 hypothetical protein Phi18:3_gp094 [Cellulophaga phage phi18:3]YP_008242119.1 hypothetical protein Phi13:2_gp094 [Cellulophaga phage phi13:2]AGO47503.1 hypothetical protein Phi19:3_gp099 [Cellulophaga phage phi19:3]AGO48606.1 hypothetical protein Phi18:3_gp094 [Cellulophaga phage phi18:3]AGO48834.1 hypothetical protein Phi46:3_gp090 [Ce
MTKTIAIIAITILITSLIWWFGINPVSDKSYINVIKEKDSIILVQKNIILDAYKDINDSIQYGKDIQHIKKLHDRYPDDAILDSLLRAGQELR